jgi:tetratricopeptide (TPR) repeat protein
MPIRPEDLKTGGAQIGTVAASLLRKHADAALPVPGERVGAYRIVAELGRGGMAVVYRAERDDGEYSQAVALKWIAGGRADATSAELFRRERQALADLNHPHIARLLDGGRSSSGLPWLAMELVEGEGIDRHAHRLGLDPGRRLALFLQVCSAVAFAHGRGILHRDIKPGNVLVDAAGNAKLLDFGLAQLLGQDDALAAGAHTPGFASPEQRRGERLTVASDVFQMGRLLRALLVPSDPGSPLPATAAAAAMTTAGTVGADATDDAGRAPVPGGSGPDRIAQGNPAYLTPDLSAIIAKACDDDPDRRYATTDALATDIRAVLETRPVAARPPRASYLARRFIQRNRWPVAATATAVALLVATIIAFTTQLRIQRDAATYQARLATSTLDFLREDLLSAASPEQGLGRELSVREALDLASASAATRFRRAPLEHGSIRLTLAELYLSLGRLQEAEREADLARTLAVEAGDPTLASAAGLSLAQVLLVRDRLDAAQDLLDQLDAATLATPDEAALRRRLWLQLLQADLANRRGDFDRAEQLADSARRLAVERLGEDDAMSLTAADDRGRYLQMLGRHDEAVAAMAGVHARRLRDLGPLHPRTLESAHGLGVMYRHQGAFDRALEWLQPTLDGRRRVLGPEHPLTLASANETATCLQELRRFDDAEPLFVATLAAREAQLGAEHHYTRNSMSNLGLLYSLWGRPAQAAPLYERALAIERRLIGVDHPDTLALMHNIAGLYRSQGRFAEAMAMHDQVLAGGRSRLGAQAWQVGMFLAGQARTFAAAGRHPDADRSMADAVAVLEASLGPHHARTQRARELRIELAATAAAP